MMMGIIIINRIEQTDQVEEDEWKSVFSKLTVCRPDKLKQMRLVAVAELWQK